ncbi:olfactory receptor 13G1-like [Lissotriton helveticus]
MDLIPFQQINQTSVSMFFIMGFARYPSLQSTFFAIFLLSYLLAISGNLLITLIIYSDTHLHTPMYFFLVNLSILDICFTSCITPNLLEIFLSETKSMSYWSCMSQMFLLSCALGTELMLLVVMAFDRYVAICLPLHYSVIMRSNVYFSMAATVWILGILNSMLHVGLILRLSFSERVILDHFFCEIPTVTKVSLSDSHTIRLVTLVADIFLGMMCFFFIIVTYTFIISSIVRIRSADKKKKAFSTCVSHLLVVNLFYGSISYTYILPASNIRGNHDKIVSALYAVVSPVLNPMIYSLRNQDVKRAFLKMFCKNILPQR